MEKENKENNENKPTKDRESTEKKILDAVGTIIAEEGFEKVGVNLVAQKAGVSKMLIYRYFGSLEDLIATYILRKDYWINISTDEMKIRDAGRFIKKVFREQIAQLRRDVTMRRLYRWELSTDNPVIGQLREKREANGCKLIEIVGRLTHSPTKEIAALASIVSASISYLTMLEESSPVYNGINLHTDSGWEDIAQGIDLIIDLWIQNQQP